MRDGLATAERAAKAIQDKLDSLDEAFLFERSIDIDTYDRHAEKLRRSSPSPESTSLRQLENLDVERILGFAERVVPRAGDLWVRPPSNSAPFQQLFFPRGIAFDGKGLIRTGVTAPAFSYLREIRTENEGLVAQIFTSSSPLTSRLRQVEGVRVAS